MNAAVREDLVVAEQHFRRACEQVLILNKEVEHLTKRYETAETVGNKTLRDQLRLRISVAEGVRNMFYEFAAHKATVITQLQRLVLATELDDDDSSDIELSAMMNESSIDADDSLEFYWLFFFLSTTKGSYQNHYIIQKEYLYACAEPVSPQ